MINRENKAKVGGHGCRRNNHKITRFVSKTKITETGIQMQRAHHNYDVDFSGAPEVELPAGVTVDSDVLAEDPSSDLEVASVLD